MNDEQSEKIIYPYRPKGFRSDFVGSRDAWESGFWDGYEAGTKETEQLKEIVRIAISYVKGPWIKNSSTKDDLIRALVNLKNSGVTYIFSEK